MRKRIRNFFTTMNQQGTSSAEENELQNNGLGNEASSPEEQIVAESEVLNDEPANPEQVQESLQGENWESKYAEMNDRYLRLYSEFDNYRKRSARERVDLVKTAAADIFTAILPVLDDFDRAAKAMETANDIEVVKDGMKLIHTKFGNILKAKGLEEMPSMGQVFDADVHEAITSIPAPDESLKGKVVDEVEKGYALNGKVIRFAKVVVGS
ncbi:MAG TPA: nucleotide exchange factor GrpE [Flavobacteriales bacterium]|nr:nucleotide exchange factor GrpE [Flavobacteriales bacterium]